MQAVILAHPDRIVLDAAGALFKVDKSEIPINTGPVKAVRIELVQAHPPVTRIVVDTSAPSHSLSGQNAIQPLWKSRYIANDRGGQL